MKAGEKLTVTMQGTPGGTASFEIPGVVTQMPMKEMSPGNYEAVWKVPSNAPSVSMARVFGKLAVAGKSLLIQAVVPVSIDTSIPAIKDMEPQPDSISSLTRPNISDVYGDAAGSGIDPKLVTLTIDGVNVSDNANIGLSFISYRPETPLSPGEKKVVLTVADKAMNKSVSTWKFTVKYASQALKSITHTAPDNAGPGDIVSVRMEGEKGGSAKFWFVTAAGTKLREQSLNEVSPGVYTGEYTIRRNDDLAKSALVGSLVSTGGQVYTLEADKKLGTRALPLVSPEITFPVDAGSVPSPVVILGRAAPGSQIQFNVTYVSLALGAFRTNGTLAEQTVTAGEDGKFQSEPVKLGTMLVGKGATYTLTAVTVGADGSLSLSTKVDFQKK